MTRNVIRGIGIVLAAGVAGLGLPGVASAAPPPGCTESGTTVTCEFGFTGAEQAFVVPDGVTALRVRAVGAAGGRGDRTGGEFAPGGAGAEVGGGLTGLTPGSTLYLTVGGAGEFETAGFNGGGPVDGLGGGGGGASDVRTVSRSATGTLESRVVVAGGGGGGGAAGLPTGIPGGPGGAAGSAGQDGSGTRGLPGGTGGGPGTATAGGTPGRSTPPQSDPPAGPGTLGEGGSSSNGGSGGGGLYGGGGGGGITLVDFGYTAAGGGGGGSSLVPPDGTSGTASGPASITLSYDVAAPPVADRADLQATLTVPATLRAGTSAPVTLTVRNAGPARTVGSGIALPAGLTITGGGGGKVTGDRRAVGFLAPTIASNATVMYTVTVTAAPNVRGAKNVGGGVLSAATRDPNLGNNYQVRPISITR